MRVRAASSDDALAIAALHAESWRVAYRGAYRDEYLDGDVVGERMGVWTKRLSAPPPNQFVAVAVLSTDPMGGRLLSSATRLMQGLIAKTQR